MTDRLKELSETRLHLKATKTRVTREDGSVIEEEKTENGEFVVIFERANGNGNPCGFKQSKRMQKGRGYVIDLSPDLQVANVSKSIYLSSQDVAQDLSLLQRHGITHIVNAASGVRCFFPKEMLYLKLKLLDMPSENLKKHFCRVHRFMKNSIDKNGKVMAFWQVLVHCNAGISRSTALVLSFLMRFEGQLLTEALALVREQRPVAHPNEGFMAQLREYERELGLSPKKPEEGIVQTTTSICH